MKKLLILLLTAFATSVSAQKEDVTVKTGTFGNDWESLSTWECPEWFKDAKFGIWAHWGPQCQAEDGDWYARRIPQLKKFISKCKRRYDRT